MHLSPPGGEQGKEESDVPHAVPPEGVSAPGKKFIIFPSISSPQVSPEANGKDKTFSLGFLDHESDSGPAWELI